MLACFLAGACRSASSRLSGEGDGSVAAVEDARAPTPADAVVDAGSPPRLIEPAIPIHAMHDWVSSDVYEVRVDGVKNCGGTAAGPLVLGVKVQVRARFDEMPVAPRHGTLQDKGVLFDPKPSTATPGCAPQLGATMLKKGQVATGYVIFELPGPRENLVLNWQPTRWGGAGIVRIAVTMP